MLWRWVQLCPCCLFSATVQAALLGQLQDPTKKTQQGIGAGKRPPESLPLVPCSPSPAVELVEMLQSKAGGFVPLRHGYSPWENEVFFCWEVKCQVLFKAGGLKPRVRVFLI